MPFSGFDAHQPQASLPRSFFTELLPRIDHLAELKLTLYALWRSEQHEGPVFYMRRDDLAADQEFIQMLGRKPEAQAAALDEALERAVDRGSLLRAEIPGAGPIYLLNSARGLAALRGLEQGKWSPEDDELRTADTTPPRPNIFQLYETNIGPLTPLLAERLMEAERTYPADWIEDALRIALENNVRKWRYVEAILKSWQEKGRDDRKDRQDSEENRRKYVEGEFSEYIEK